MRGMLTAVFIALAVSPPALGEVEETRATLRQHALTLINRDRAIYDLPPLELDLQASTIGDDYCREQIRNRSTGHYSTSGLTPYMRYSFGGGDDGISENAAAWSAPDAFNERALYEMVRRTQDAMMAESPPRDGHKRAILDPHATHVGIGLAWQGGEFRMVHLFVRRYLHWFERLPREAELGQQVLAKGRALNGAVIESVSVHFESTPVAMPRHVVNAFDSYSLPSNRRDYVPEPPRPIEQPHEKSIHLARRQRAQSPLQVAPSGEFSFRVPLTEGPGTYTVVIWVRPDGAASPAAASNISIRVGRPAGSASQPGAIGR